ncbi:amino acid/polyamine/organocation transporter (APC superfamily) [Glutamicibacter mysorens]|uniref:Amino acid/polyamine/organocation transporter (APC superfamily) n=1 Tax=Glutamicibacter mysorens TaxID=257984 RepID=A0ABX4MWS9_9MICC|nr:MULTISPECIES: amino acid permease [Glutamicibacter]PJJ43989.1 amino acid/polyamine/organocation transporter (APC superfamily) [Glutamicibacter mysorens]
MSAVKAPEQLHAGLTQRQISMMGLGGAIGAGLFVGSGQAISIAGPAVLVSYLIAGTVIIVIMAMLAEMVAANPSSGAFSTFAGQAMGRSAGSTLGWLYWVQLVVVIAAEATGAAAITAGWVPAFPQWAWVLSFVVILTGANLLGVRNYGRFEYWFAVIKVAAIIAFLAFGALVLAGVIPTPEPVGFANLAAHGGFAPGGMAGIAAAVLIVIFSFGGTEVVSIAAAESKDPAGNIKRVVKSVMLRILFFYLGSILVIVALVPWNDPAVAEGPFAAALDVMHIPGVGFMMNAVVVVALLSAMNANIYGSSRMLYSLGQRKLAPRAVTHVTGKGVPAKSVISSVSFSFLAVGLNWIWPDAVMPILLNVVGSTIIVIWAFIAVTQLILRRRADRDGAHLPLRLWGFPGLSIATIVLLAAIVAIAMTDPAARTQLLLTGGLTAAIWVISKIALRDKSGDSADA